MVGYINSVRDREYKQCTPEIFEQLVQSPMVTTHIEEYRKGNEKSKSLLPAFLFQGYDPNVLLGKKGSRLAKALKPTGFFIMDFDHIESPHKVYDTFLKRLPSLGFDLHKDVALAHVTPSGQGLRLVLVTPKGMTIEASQEWVAKIMEIECDAVVKDLSRLSFCPMASDILYINKVLLFGNVAMAENPVRDALSVAQGFNPGIQNDTQTPSPSGEASVIKEASPKGEDATANNTPGVETPRYKEDVPTAQSGAATSPSVTPYGATAECGDENTPSNNRAASTTPSIFPECYNGIPYKRIVEELILLHGGEPQVGNRENTIFRLASDLAKITDRSAPWLESLIPTFGLPEQEWRTTISQVCKKPLETSMSRKLQEAIKRCKDEMALSTPLPTGEGSGGEALPPAMPENLPYLVKLLTSKVLPHQRPAVAAMIFPALAVHVNNCLFKLSDNTDVELGLMCCLLAKQSVGKGCVNAPLKAIMADIEAEDEINRQRERTWAEKNKNKKANEKGESRPDDLVIRILDSDTTPAAFLGRLFAAEHGNEDGRNYCTYSQVEEIEDLYSFCATGGKNKVRQMIKRSWDRGRIGAERWTANAANFKTVLRWNWAASSTIEGGKSFFKNCLTDGTTSRVDFCTIIPPAGVIEFRYGTYDEGFRNALRPYIDNLRRFACQHDADGGIVPAVFPEIRAIEERMNRHINDYASTEPDNTWESYAWRAKVMAIKKLIVLYVAGGCRWEEEMEAFAWWSFHYSMWCKINLFYDAAMVKFEEERIGDRGHQSPLKDMPRTFTFSDFAAVCQRMGIKTPPIKVLSKYKGRGLITQSGDRYTIVPEFAEKHGIQ